MSKAGKFSITMLQKYETMIEDRFSPILAAADRATAPLRFSIQEEIKKEWGIYELEAQLAIAKEKVSSLESELASKKGSNGKYCYAGRGTTWVENDSRIDNEIKRRLRERDGVYERIFTEKKKIVDELWLAQAPEELVRIIRDIDTTTYMDEVKQLEDKVVSMGLVLLEEGESGT